MNRIDARFARLHHDGHKAVVVYIGAGDPDLEGTRRLALCLDEAGVDVLELGVPFSDPLADGLVNQLSAQRGLESGTTPAGVFQMVQTLRKDSQVPIVLYLYYNLLHRHGLQRFVAEAAAAGVDGLLVLDLPPEEADNYEAWMRQAGLHPIFLVAPTTPEERIRLIVQKASGFIYCVSREGVTGMQSRVSDTIAPLTARIRAHTSLPIVVGFGVSNPEQARTASASADGVVVGSAVVNRIAELGRSPDMPRQVATFVRSLVEAVKG